MYCNRKKIAGNVCRSNNRRGYFLQSAFQWNIFRIMSGSICALVIHGKDVCRLSLKENCISFVDFLHFPSCFPHNCKRNDWKTKNTLLADHFLRPPRVEKTVYTLNFTLLHLTHLNSETSARNSNEFYCFSRISFLSMARKDSMGICSKRWR